MRTMNGYTSAPNSATRNGTRCTMSPAMKCTSRDNRSSLATSTGQSRRRAAARAAASYGLRSRASDPFQVSTSVNSSQTWWPVPAAN